MNKYKILGIVCFCFVLLMIILTYITKEIDPYIIIGIIVFLLFGIYIYYIGILENKVNKLKKVKAK